MFSKCPGQDARNLRVKLYKCPGCGNSVELFSDELMVRCPQCRTKVYAEKIPSCIEWCASARKCLGEEKWQKLQGDIESARQDKETKDVHKDVKKNR